MISISCFIPFRKKKYTCTVNAFLPETVIIPFRQAHNAYSTSIVAPGQPVTEGQVIACDTNAKECSIANNIHASIPGTIIDLCVTPLPNGQESPAAKIKLQGGFTYRGKKQYASDWKNISTDVLVHRIAEQGVINTFESRRPESLANQILLGMGKKSRIAIVRLCDEDPTCTTDSSLAMIYPERVQIGAAILAKAMGASGIVFVKQQKFEEQNTDKSNLFNVPVSYISINCKKYPCGFKRDILAALRKTASKEPFLEANINDLYVDVSTMVQLYNAIVFSVPVIEQYVQVTGNCLSYSGLLKTCIGTPVGSLAEQCGGLKKTPAKIIVNGLLTGYAVSSLDVPVTKYVKSIEFVPAKQVPRQFRTTCIRCGKCRNICPRGLCPDVLYMHVIRAVNIDDQYLKTAELCTGCSLCNTVCPSRLPLSQAIALLKDDDNE